MAVVTEKQKCQRCGNKRIVTDLELGELICASCGFVVLDRIEDYGPEHRNFLDGGPDKSRTGDKISLTRHDKGLSTMIGPYNRDAGGSAVSSSMKNTLGRLRIWDKRSQANSPMERNYRQAFNELKRLKDKLGLSDAIVEKTAYIYRKALEKKLNKGRSISALISASLYAACRDADTPRTLSEISELGNVKRKELSKCYRLLLKELDLKVPVASAIQCVSRIASRLDLSEKTKRHAIEILKQYQASGEIAGKSPMGLAATALYLADAKTGGWYTQREVAEAANITEVTIRNRGAAIKKVVNIA